MKNQEPVLVFVPDLFFQAKIVATARSTNASVRVLASREALIEDCRGAGQRTVILDLTAGWPDPINLIRTLKQGRETITFIGFYSHVDKGLECRAREAGCDLVLPKSTFSKRLPEILTGALSIG